MNRHFIDYNAPAPKYAEQPQAFSWKIYAAKADLEASRKAAQAADAKAYEKMIPPAPPKPREAPYQPEGFSYAHVNSKGQQETPIPAREKEGEKPAPTVWYSAREKEWYRRTPDGGNEYKTSEHGEWKKGAWTWENLQRRVTDLTPF